MLVSPSDMSASSSSKPEPRAIQPPREPTSAFPTFFGWWFLALAGAVALAYFPAARGGLLWDDDAHVTAPALRSLHGLWRIWFELGATQQYYPLLHSAFWLEHRLWGDATLGYHLTNVALHLLNAGLVALLLRRLKVPGATLAACVFALHPVQVESVAWISEQKNTLSTAFYLAAAIAYWDFDQAIGAKRRWLTYAIATLLFVAALATKSVTATLPAALLVVVWWQRGRISWRRDVAPLAPWLVLGIGAGLFTAWVEHAIVGAHGATFQLDAGQRLLLAGRTLWFYFGKLLWPAGLVFIYPHWTLDPTQLAQWCPLAGTLVVGIGLWRFRRRSRAPLAVALIYAGTLFPVLGFISIYPFQYSYVADHFQYLASIAVIAAVAAACCRGHRPRLQRSVTSGWRAAVAVAMLAVLALLSWRQAHAYADAETLYRTTLRGNPECLMADNNLGKLLMTQPGRLPEAIMHFEHALAVHPEYAEAENNFGLALTQSGRPREAIGHLQHAVTLKPSSYEVRNNLAIALAKTGQFDAAIAEFAKAAALNPRLSNLEENWGKALLLAGRPAEAQAHFERAKQLRAGAP